MKWSDIKKKGSIHYKGNKVEPIDLIKEGKMLRSFALGNIIKYAYRSREGYKECRVDDMYKIIHYAEMVLAEEEENENRTRQRDKG